MENAYGRPEWFRHNPPLDELVLTILSQNTTSLNCRRAYDSLRAAFPEWEDARTATVDQIARSIYSCGLSVTKSARIKNILQRIWEERRVLDLDWLESLPFEEARRVLLSFEGVGPKTASCVLLFSFGWPALPVDTHVHRVAKRLRLVPEKANADTTQEILERIVPDTSKYSFHINAIRLGRQVCRPSAPRCDICVLNKECAFGQSGHRPD